MESIMPFVPQFIKKIPVHMDFEGQKKAEQIFQGIILIFAAVGLLWGYMVQFFSYTVFTLFAGFGVACLITLPPWPFFRNNPIEWQSEVKPAEDEGKKGGKKKK